jgi:hypothetical protein
MAAAATDKSRFAALLLEGLEHYRKGLMLQAVHCWEEAYRLEPSNLRAREFLRSALERINAQLQASKPPPAAGAAAEPSAPPKRASSKPGARASPPAGSTAPSLVPSGGPAAGHPWLPPRGDAPKGPRPYPLASARPVAPWDDGPSVAVPVDARYDDQLPGSGVWKIHEDQPSARRTDRSATAPPAAKAAPAQRPASEAGEPQDDVSVWRSGARELFGLNDFTGALELFQKIQRRQPEDAEAAKMIPVCESNLIQMYESKMGDTERRPRVAIQPDEVIWLSLDPRAGFVLAQIDGAVTFEDLYAICGLSRLDTARILHQLLEEGVVASDPPEHVARR